MSKLYRLIVETAEYKEKNPLAEVLKRIILDILANDIYTEFRVCDLARLLTRVDWLRELLEDLMPLRLVKKEFGTGTIPMDDILRNPGKHLNDNTMLQSIQPNPGRKIIKKLISFGALYYRDGYIFLKDYGLVNPFAYDDIYLAWGDYVIRDVVKDFLGFLPGRITVEGGEEDDAPKEAKISIAGIDGLLRLQMDPERHVPRIAFDFDFYTEPADTTRVSVYLNVIAHPAEAPLSRIPRFKEKLETLLETQLTIPLIQYPDKIVWDKNKGIVRLRKSFYMITDIVVENGKMKIYKDKLDIRVYDEGNNPKHYIYYTLFAKKLRVDVYMITKVFRDNEYMFDATAHRELTLLDPVLARKIPRLLSSITCRELFSKEIPEAELLLRLPRNDHNLQLMVGILLSISKDSWYSSEELEDYIRYYALVNNVFHSKETMVTTAREVFRSNILSYLRKGIITITNDDIIINGVSLHPYIEKIHGDIKKVIDVLKQIRELHQLVRSQEHALTKKTVGHVRPQMVST